MINRIQENLKWLGRRSDYAEIRFEESENLFIKMTDREEPGVEKNIGNGFNIRVAVSGAWGFTSFSNLDHIENMAQKTLSMAKQMGKKKTVLADVEPVNDMVELSLVSDPGKVSLDDKISVVKEYSDICYNFDPSIKRVRSSYSEDWNRVVFLSSEGAHIEQHFMEAGVDITAESRKNGVKEESVISFTTMANYQDLTEKRAEIEKCLNHLTQKAGAVPVKGGVYPVLMDPAFAGLFIHESFGHMCEADELIFNQELQETLKTGRKIASPLLTVGDSGIVAGLRGSAKYDDEGVKTGETYLIRKGVITGYLSSRESAGILGIKPSGNARAQDFRYPPIVRMRNTFIDRGDAAFEDLLSEIKLGIYCIDSEGGCGGEFFTFCPQYAYMIRSGKICEPVRNVKVSGNLFKALKDVIGIGNDFKYMNVGGYCGKFDQIVATSESSPHVLVKNLKVGGGVGNA